MSSHQKRFESQFEKSPDGCWLWVGSCKSVKGEIRGRVMLDGKRDYVHRWAYRIYSGEIPDGKQVNHHCDNPLCVNPDHLYLGTQQENVADRDRRRRRAPPIGEKNGRAKISSDDAIAIFKSKTPARVLARRYQITPEAIGMIRNKRTWKHIHQEGNNGS